jgi:hypothetical protein
MEKGQGGNQDIEIPLSLTQVFMITGFLVRSPIGKLLLISNATPSAVNMAHYFGQS